MRQVPYKYIVAVIFVFALFMDIMDLTIVNVALPTLAQQFGVTTAGVEWIVLGYLLSLAVWIPASGWIGDKFGTKKTFLFALAMFTIASILCGQSHSLGELVAFRILQGVGGGMLTPVGTAMLFRAFPPQERAKASSVLILPTVLAPATGPVLGGWLVTNHSWRWIFYVNVPIGIAAFVFGALFLRENKEPTAGAFDVAGFVLSGAGLALILFALSEAPTHGWLSPEIVITGVLGVIATAVLIYVETHKPEPMLALRLFADRMFRNANVTNFLSYGSFIGLVFLLPLYLQELRGLSALQSGLTTFPQAIGVMVSSQIVGRLYHRVGPRRLIAFGLTGAAITVLCFTQIGLTTDLWVIRGLMFTRGIFMAFAFVPLQAATYSTITPADTGRASALYSTQRQVGAAVGVAILATVFISMVNRYAVGAGSAAEAAAGQMKAYHIAFAVASFISLLAAASALRIRDEDAAATIRRRSPALATEAAH
jgi:EmrB/QacA subfamily drug resistance transporter